MKIQVKVDLLGSLKKGFIPKEGPEVEFDRSQDWSAEAITSVARYCKQTGDKVHFNLIVDSATPESVITAALNEDQRRADIEARELERKSQRDAEMAERRDRERRERAQRLTREQWEAKQTAAASHWAIKHGSQKLKSTRFDSKEFLPLYRSERQRHRARLEKLYPGWTWDIDVSETLLPASPSTPEDLRLLSAAREQIEGAVLMELGDRNVPVSEFNYSYIIFGVEADVSIDDYEDDEEEDEDEDEDDEDEDDEDEDDEDDEDADEY